MEVMHSEPVRTPMGEYKANPKRVALFIKDLETGGIQRAVLTLANEMAERGYDVDLVLANKEGALRREVSDQVNVCNLHARRVITSIPGFLTYMRSRRPEVVLSASDSINIVLPWVKKITRLDARIVLCVQNNLTMYATNKGVWYSGAHARFVRRAYPRADRIVAVSDGVARDLARLSGVHRNEIAVIHNPIVDEQLFSKAQQAVEHSWFKTTEQPVILGIGRFVPQKNFSLLLRAFAEICTTIEARLILLGDGPDRAELKASIKDLDIEGKVDMPGFVENPYSYLAKASLFVLSSVHEGLGNVLVEALACGCPVVSTDCPSGPREILEDGKRGKLVPVNDWRALATAMLDTLSEPKDPEGLRQRAEDFSVSKVVDHYLDVLFPRK